MSTAGKEMGRDERDGDEDGDDWRARARALHYSFGIFIAAGSGSVRPSAPASSFRQRYCLFKFRVRVCARTHAPSSLPLSPPEYSLKINFFSFAVESLEGPDLGLRRLTRADMGAYLVPI